MLVSRRYRRSVAIHRTRKNKENPNYQFLVSWEPKKTSVKGESGLPHPQPRKKISRSKSADLMSQENTHARIKKDIIKSLILVSLVLILEVVVYLASEFKILSL